MFSLILSSELFTHVPVACPFALKFHTTKGDALSERSAICTDWMEAPPVRNAPIVHSPVHHPPRRKLTQSPGEGFTFDTLVTTIALLIVSPL